MLLVKEIEGRECIIKQDYVSTGQSEVGTSSPVRDSSQSQCKDKCINVSGWEFIYIFYIFSKAFLYVGRKMHCVYI